ncbi:HK97-gp10 family putative phage morphogenesis protein [Lysinibacillus parviboronicapiens]|uniref:HK97-gp10 family putative phage morphogenesis protein n=1 Tax=Lysinibacillus parviboronicapiens TaxID=436516 RepID=UPI000D344815|nr:HK97-gp10 family putative phage morphogenesis protein [Lysinibacillus parviboronicapiens]
MRIDFTGLEELQRELQQRLDSDSILEPTLKKGAEYLKDKLEENVYNFGFKKRSGRSEESMVIDSKILDNSLAVGLSNQNNDAFYLYFHEIGTSKMPARPWFRPTFEREMNRIIEIMKNELSTRMRL